MTRRAFPGVALWILATATLGAAVGAEIRVTPVVADGRVAASFRSPTSFTDEARTVVQSGLLLTFTYTVELRRPSAVWFDRTLGTAVVASTGTFDNLTGVYQISKLEDGRVVWSDRTQDDSQVRAWMTTFDDVSLALDERLQPNVEYYVRVRMQSTPRRTFTVWPFGGDEGIGRATFTLKP